MIALWRSSESVINLKVSSTRSLLSRTATRSGHVELSVPLLAPSDRVAVRLDRMPFTSCFAMPSAPSLIASGVVCVAIALVLPPGVALTGVALISLGATVTLSQRPEGDPVLLALQGVVYAGLYLLFVSAVWHSADGNPPPLVLADFAVSLVLIAAHVPLARRLVRQ